MSRAHVGVIVIVVAALVGVAGRALAQTPDVQGEMLVVFASHDAGSIDPAVAEEAALHQPPFDTFHAMRVLSRHVFVVGTHAPYTRWLENGRTLRIELLDHPGPRLAARVSISRANNAPDFLPGVTVETDPGVPFVVAGQSYEAPDVGRGTLVLLVRLGARASSAAAAAIRLSPSLQAPLRLVARPGTPSTAPPVATAGTPATPPAPTSAAPAPAAPLAPPPSTTPTPAPPTPAAPTSARPANGASTARKNAPPAHAPAHPAVDS